MNFWERLLEFIKNEPAAFGGAILALVQAVLVTIVAFNVELTIEQQKAIIGLTTALVSATVIVAAIVRNSVTPTNRPRSNDGEELVIKQPVAEQPE